MAAPPPLALSTMWFQRWDDQRDLGPFFDLGARMGFTAFELSHILAPATVARVDPARTRIAAVHHPCPRLAPPASGAALIAADAAERRRAAEALCATLRTADRVGARAVVLHAGALADTPRAPIRKLAFEVDSRCRAGQRGQPAYAQPLARLADAFAALEPAALDHLVDALAAPMALARDLGIRIGLETGYHPYEVPGPGGMHRLLGALPGTEIGAWLDTGHVGAQVNLGRVTWADWFAAADGRWVGAHFHDVVGLRDHLIPGTGDVDFMAIGAVLPPEAIRSCEFDWYFTPDEVMRGAAHLRAAACGA